MSDGQKHMQHTAGPWRRQRPHGSDIPVWGADGKSRGCVALVNMSAERAAEAEANAVLIAAAPETAAERDRLREVNAVMLAALTCSTAVIEACLPFLSGERRRMADMQIAANRAAIAKAEGR